jgi:hypothetical protein
VVYRLRRPWSDGTSAIVFEPLAFLERLAALVPRPRAHLLTYHGVLAPAAQWRDRIVPGPRASTESDHVSTEPRAAYSSRPATSSSPDSNAALSSPARTRRLRWPELLRRLFAVDVLTCPDCGGARKLFAMITEGLVARRILGPPRAAQLATDDHSRKSASRARVRLVAPEGSELRASKRGAVWRRHATARPPRAPDRFQAAPEAPLGSSTDAEGTGSTRPRDPRRRGIGPNRYPFPGVIRLEFLSPHAEAKRADLRILQAIGTDDETLPANRAFHAHLQSLGIAHDYIELAATAHEPLRTLQRLEDRLWDFLRDCFAAAGR